MDKNTKIKIQFHYHPCISLSLFIVCHSVENRIHARQPRFTFYGKCCVVFSEMCRLFAYVLSTFFPYHAAVNRLPD